MKSIALKLKLTGFTVLSLFAFLFLTSAKVVPANADFSGGWTLNESKSELGQYGGRMAARKMTIVADANGLSAEKMVPSQDGETKRTDKLTFDGKVTESPFFGTNVRKSTAKWSADGQSLAVNWSAVFDGNGQQMEIKGDDTWKLGDGGAALIIESTSTSSFGTIKTKLVYDFI
jgi:hypothetical protein